MMIMIDVHPGFSLDAMLPNERFNELSSTGSQLADVTSVA